MGRSSAEGRRLSTATLEFFTPHSPQIPQKARQLLRCLVRQDVTASGLSLCITQGNIGESVSLYYNQRPSQ